MRFNALIVATALALISAPALARHCPADMKKIDKALSADPKLSNAEMTQVKELRAEGEQLHKDGKHQQSEEALAKAMKILNIE